MKDRELHELHELLASMGDVLFPGLDDVAEVTVHTHGTEGDTPLHVAAWRGDSRAVELLLSAGSVIDAIGDMNQTALHVAVMREDLKMTSILLAAGASPDVRSEFGDTPAELAATQGGEMGTMFKQHAVAQQAVAADRAKPRSG